MTQWIKFIKTIYRLCTLFKKSQSDLSPHAGYTFFVWFSSVPWSKWCNKTAQQDSTIPLHILQTLQFFSHSHNILVLDSVIGIFHWHNPSGRTMAVGLTACDRNEYQEYFLGGKGGQCIGLTTLPHSCADSLEIWEPRPPGTIRACNGIALPLPFKLRNWQSYFN